MIYESRYWKDDLLRLAEDLRRRKNQRRWPEDSFAKVEKAVMIGCYSIRKLIEAKKLSDELVQEAVPVTRFAGTGKNVNLMNRHDFWELYDLESPENGELDPLTLCHLIVHSYVFVLSFDEQGTFNGIYFNSDRTRHAYLYFVSVDDLAALFEAVGEDYPAFGQFDYDDKLKDFRIVLRREAKA